MSGRWRDFDLAVKPPFPPMEAKRIEKLPEGEGWQFEPKWDGFRCIAFKEDETVALQSKAGLPLGRYFPEVEESVRRLAPKKLVFDGELVIPSGETFSFEELQMRIHPAESRVKKLSLEIPASFQVFDLLVDDRAASLVSLPLKERREKLEAFHGKRLAQDPRFLLSPATTDRGELPRWETDLRKKGIDGIICKRLDMAYCSGNRTGMQKFKWIRTADCVVGGFRYGNGTKVVGSLLLGLHDAKGILHHVGFCSGLAAKEKKALTAKLEKLRKAPGFTGHAPGGPSRWSTERSGEWEPLDPVLVVEVSYDHVSGGRFRHGTKLVRWRTDKAPAQCTFEQIGLKGRD